MTGLFNVDPDTIIVIACVIGVIQVAVHILKRAFDLWFATAGRKADPIERLADGLKEPKPYAPPEVKPENEPAWDGKAPHRPATRRLFALAEPVVVIGGNPARFDLTKFAPASGALSAVVPETASEISGRHALVPPDSSTTGVMPAVVDDERALAVVASVSGGDGAG